jgi:type IV secretion system protein VirB1
MVTLAQLLHDCAPNVDPRTMTAIVRVESAGKTFALRDNTLDTVYYPPDNATAVAWTNQLLRRGDNLDLGLSQINSANLARLGISVNEIFNPCVNLRAGSTILGEDYNSAASHFGSGQFALRRALGAYNSGSLYAGQGYVNSILAAAGLASEQDYPVTAAAAAPEPATPKAAGGKHAKHAAASTEPEPAYTLQHTSGSPVTVIVGS